MHLIRRIVLKLFRGVPIEKHEMLQDMLFKAQKNDQPRDAKTGRFMKKKF